MRVGDFARIEANTIPKISARVLGSHWHHYGLTDVSTLRNPDHHCHLRRSLGFNMGAVARRGLEHLMCRIALPPAAAGFHKPNIAATKNIFFVYASPAAFRRAPRGGRGSKMPRQIGFRTTSEQPARRGQCASARRASGTAVSRMSSGRNSEFSCDISRPIT
jgi:hypothetical protein